MEIFERPEFYLPMDKNSLQNRVDTDIELRNGIVDFYPLSIFLRNCILAPDFHYPDDLSRCVSFTQEGLRALEELKTQFPNLSDGDAYAVVIAVFSHQELFLDFGNSSSDLLQKIISTEVEDLRIRYAFVRNRDLIDRYFELFGFNLMRTLNSKDTQHLLENTPQGVSQLGHYCTGPFGILRTDHLRIVPIQLEGNIAQCDRKNCHSLHPVSFTTSQTDAGSAYAYLVERINATWPMSSHWTSLCSKLMIPNQLLFRPLSSIRLLELLANSLSLVELRKLLKVCVDDSSTGSGKSVNQWC
jgi:hypothetical protein